MEKVDQIVNDDVCEDVAKQKPVGVLVMMFVNVIERHYINLIKSCSVSGYVNRLAATLSPGISDGSNRSSVVAFGYCHHAQ